MVLQLGRYEFKPGLIPTLVFLLLLPGLLSLGLWQLDRAGEKKLLMDQRDAVRDSAPLDLAEATSDDMDRYRPASVTGRYDASQQWLLDNRIFRGQAGYHVFSLLHMSGERGRKLLVNRGWISVGQSREFLPQLPLPEGVVALQGRLDRPGSVGLKLGEPPLDSIADRVLVQSLEVDELAEAKGLQLLPLVLVLDADQPSALQYDWVESSELGPEKHLGYAFQWFALATALVMIYVGVNTRKKV